MRYLGAYFVAFVMVWYLSACTTIRCGSSKEQYLSAFDAFMQDVENLDLGIADPRWKIYDQKLETYLTQCYPEFEDDLSLHEKHELLTDALRFYYMRYGSDMIRELQNTENPSSVFIKDKMTELWERPDEILREILGKDWEELVNEFMEDLQKWKLKLQEFLEN